MVGNSFQRKILSQACEFMFAFWMPIFR